MSTSTNIIPILLAQIVLILGLSRLLGLVFGKFGQPQVVGEMVAGILLGPSLFGFLAPHYWRVVFPAESWPLIDALSQVGMVVFLFLVGLELDVTLIRGSGRAALAISQASILTPFLLGLGLGLFLYPRLYSAGGSGVFPTALFMGAAMSITAFPVLARILIEGKLHKTRIGTIALACAAVADATAWCGLAFVVAIVRSANLWPAAFTIVKVLAFVALMFWVVRPMLRKLETYYDRTGQLSQNVMAIVFILLLASAWTTEAIGIHALFGAFLMGAMMPKRMSFVLAIRQKLEDLIVVFLLPLFFAYTGLRTEISLLNTAALWGYAGLIILVSCLGKFGGSTLAGRAVGLGWRESSAIGILMNTRGLMELVILNIGKDIGVINRPVFAMMVMMAILTTLLTTPILRWVYPQRVAVLGAQQSAPVEAAALSSGG